MKALKSMGYVWDHFVARRAALSGHIHILQYILDSNSECVRDHRVAHAVIKDIRYFIESKNSREVMEFLISHGAVIDQTTYGGALGEIAHWLKNNVVEAMHYTPYGRYKRGSHNGYISQRHDVIYVSKTFIGHYNNATEYTIDPVPVDAIERVTTYHKLFMVLFIYALRLYRDYRRDDIVE
jgi:hypothetical protein